jgi:hypothetical protein
VGLHLKRYTRLWGKFSQPCSQSSNFRSFFFFFLSVTHAPSLLTSILSSRKSKKKHVRRHTHTPRLRPPCAAHGHSIQTLPPFSFNNIRCVETHNPAPRRRHTLEPRTLRAIANQIQHHPDILHGSRRIQICIERKKMGRLRRHVPSLLEHRWRNGELG